MVSSDDESGTDTPKNNPQSSLDLPAHCCLDDDRPTTEDDVEDAIRTAYIVSSLSSKNLAPSFVCGEYVYRTGSIVVLKFTEHNDIKAEVVKFGLARVVGLDCQVPPSPDDTLLVEWLLDNDNVATQSPNLSHSQLDLIEEDDLILMTDSISLTALVCPWIYFSRESSDGNDNNCLHRYSIVMDILKHKKTHGELSWYTEQHLGLDPLLSGAELRWASVDRVWQTKIGQTFFQSVTMTRVGRGNMSGREGDEYTRFALLFQAALAIAKKKTTLVPCEQTQTRCSSCGLQRTVSSRLTLPSGSSTDLKTQEPTTLTFGASCRDNLLAHAQALGRLLTFRQTPLDIDMTIPVSSEFRLVKLSESMESHFQQAIDFVLVRE